MRFLAAVVVATCIWTTALFSASLAAGELLLRHLGAWSWAGAVGLAASIVLFGHWIGRTQAARS